MHAGDEVVLISNQGTLVRIAVDEISLVGRNTQGVRLINLATGENLVGLEPVASIQSENSGVSDTTTGQDESAVQAGPSE